MYLDTADGWDYSIEAARRIRTSITTTLGRGLTRSLRPWPIGSQLRCRPAGLGAAQSVHIAAQLSRVGAGGGVIAIQPFV